ncbi:hypothetical protein [Lewinella sp. 4G2]|uniref:hypothetical protein n=1 Tax=Lewinella sp. 4G2 TaxID=1803372 RepID=UPI0007B48B4B|nr:hypothetical protein [Lewinella sp. 4G2]OAV42791.1 hypothetical protein A3850_016275 [Lewinella sp. 4G2]
MNKLFVWLIGLFGPLWERAGADPRAVKLIVATKLKVSDRVPKGMNYGARKKKPSKWMEFFSYFMMALIGLVVVVLLFKFDHQPTALGIGYSVIGIYLCMMLVLELSDSIFDTRDVSVLLSRPISDFTFALSRGLFVFAYAAKMMLSMALPPFICLAFIAPLQLPIFFLATTAITVISTVGILSFYQFLLRKLSTATLKKVLSTTQMLFSGFFIMIYLGPQLASGIDDSYYGIRLVGETAGFIFPSFWIGAWHDLGAGATTLSYVQAGLGLATVILASVVYRSQAQGYAAGLLKLGSSGSAVQETEPDGDTPVNTQTDTGPRKPSLGDRLAVLFTRPGIERASYKFHWAMMLRARSFKNKVYPTLLFAPFFVVFFMIRDGFSGGDGIFGSSLLFGLYYMMMTVITPLGQARIAEKPSAAWVWQVHPLPNRGPVAYGQYMASLSQFYLPTFLITLPLFLYQGGLGFFPDVLLAMALSIVAGALFQMLERTLPFSRAIDNNRMSNIGAVIAVFLFAGLAGFGHYLLRQLPYGIWFGLVGAVIAGFISLYWLRRMKGSFEEVVE